MRGVARIVVLANGAAGAEKQAMALAARLQDRLLRLSSAPARVPIERVDAAARGVARALPPHVHVLAALETRDAAFGYDRAAMDRSSALQRLISRRKDAGRGDRSVVIGCGRSTVALCVMLKRSNPANVFNVQIQHPRTPFAWFDAVVTPRHDFPGVQGEEPIDKTPLSMLRRLLPSPYPPENAFVTVGTVHDITPALLEQHLHQWDRRLDELVHNRTKRVVWLVGGPCRGFPFTAQQAETMAIQVATALAATGDAIALLVTFSRRTPRPVRQVIRRYLAESFPSPGQLVIWDGTEADNPFYALLASASAILTTPDSISMTTEAVASGKPVLTLLADQCSGKFARFHRHMRDAGCTKAFDAEAVHETLHSGAQDQEATSSAREALEKELATVVDALVAELVK